MLLNFGKCFAYQGDLLLAENKAREGKLPSVQRGRISLRSEFQEMRTSKCTVRRVQA